MDNITQMDSPPPTVNRRVAYFHCDDFDSLAMGPSVAALNLKRYSMAHELLRSLDLLKWTQRLRPRWLKQDELSKFHEDRYLHMLEQLSLPKSQQTLNESRLAVAVKRCGFRQESTVHKGAYQFSRVRASGSVGCAEIINSEQITLAMNFEGGMSRAKPDQAIAGHFLNDVVLCLLTLCENHTRILYVNVGYEHSDGVEEAFYTSNKVMCLSFHGNQESANDEFERHTNHVAKEEAMRQIEAEKKAAAAAEKKKKKKVLNSNGKRPAAAATRTMGEEPNKKSKTDGDAHKIPHIFSYASINGTGKQEDIGHGRGQKCNRNVPLPNGLTDSELEAAFGPIFARACSFYRPTVIVLKVNAASVASSSSKWNLSSKAYVPIIHHVRNTDIPFILLGSGGGGGNSSNSARTFASCAYAALGFTGTMPEKVPSNDRYIEDYQSYGGGNLIVSSSNMNSEVEKESFQNMINTICTSLSGPPLESDDEDDDDDDEDE
jgi:acetoin utilization deacetylase AcuC-like enzyme